MQNGKLYHGVCEGCTNERDALAYEKKIKFTAKDLASQKSVGALIENFKQELTGGTEVTLQDAFDQYLLKPSKRQPGTKQIAAKRGYWNDFVAFLKQNAPDVSQLDKITRNHAEAYINYLKKKGRFIREIQNEGQRSYTALSKLSNSTINVYHKSIRAVFSKLKEEAGLLFNPFDFEMMENDSETREAFSLEELQLIGKNLNDFVRPIFMIGICTGLSEGDICLLRWKDIQGHWISRKRKKTKVKLDIPILPPLQDFLASQRQLSGDAEYVLPEHAKMYQNNPQGISYRVKGFLESLGIRTTRSSGDRERATSIKDVHSLRHTFAYMAGCYQIPLPIVQSVLGHMSPEMTKHYQAHADRKAKEKYLSQMSEAIGISIQDSPVLALNPVHPPEDEPERKELEHILSKLPIEKIREMIKQFSGKGHLVSCQH